MEAVSKNQRINMCSLLSSKKTIKVRGEGRALGDVQSWYDGLQYQGRPSRKRAKRLPGGFGLCENSSECRLGLYQRVAKRINRLSDWRVCIVSKKRLKDENRGSEVRRKEGFPLVGEDEHEPCEWCDMPIIQPPSLDRCCLVITCLSSIKWLVDDENTMTRHLF